MLLRAGETVVLREESQYFDIQGLNLGTLYLTNQRLVFEKKAGGGLFRGPRESTLVDCTFDGIVNVSVHQPLLGGAALHVEFNSWDAQFTVADPHQWQQELARLKASLPTRVGNPPSMPQQVVQHTIERQVVKVRCRHCGTLNLETDRVCEACHAPL